MGSVYAAMAALPLLRQIGRGAFIAISLVESRRSMPLQTSYSASKHGLEGFLDSQGYNTTTGDFTDKKIPSFFDWIDLHPALKWCTSAGLGVLAIIAASIFCDKD